MLFVSKAFIIIAFGFEELIEVRLAVNIPTQRSVCPKTAQKDTKSNVSVQPLRWVYISVMVLNRFNFFQHVQKRRSYSSHRLVQPFFQERDIMSFPPASDITSKKNRLHQVQRPLAELGLHYHSHAPVQFSAL